MYVFFASLSFQLLDGRHLVHGIIERDDTGVMASLFSQVAIKPEQGGRMLVDVIIASKRETHGGEFINLDGSKLIW